MTDPPVTESPKQIPATNRITQSPEISPEEWRAKMGRLDDAEPAPAPEPVVAPEPDSMCTRKPVSAEKRKEWSRRALNEFTWACKNWLTKVTEEADRAQALKIVTEILADKKAKAA